MYRPVKSSHSVDLCEALQVFIHDFLLGGGDMQLWDSKVKHIKQMACKARQLLVCLGACPPPPPPPPPQQDFFNGYRKTCVQNR